MRSYSLKKPQGTKWKTQFWKINCAERKKGKCKMRSSDQGLKASLFCECSTCWCCLSRFMLVVCLRFIHRELSLVWLLRLFVRDTDLTHSCHTFTISYKQKSQACAHSLLLKTLCLPGLRPSHKLKQWHLCSQPKYGSHFVTFFVVSAFYRVDYVSRPINPCI